MRTPEEIKASLAPCVSRAKCDRCMGTVTCAIEEEALIYIEHIEAKLAVYEKAIEEGRMVMLPCKPGDDLYWLDDEGVENPDWTIKCQQRGVRAVVVRAKDDFAIISDDGIEEIGTRWTYLTEADAQAALEGMGNDA